MTHHATADHLVLEKEQTPESYSACIIITNARGLIRAANGNALDLFGYSTEELFDKPIESLLAERFQHHYHLQRAAPNLRSGERFEPLSKNLAGLKKDGTRIPLEVNRVPVEAASGLIFVNFIRDLSQPPAAAEDVPYSEDPARSVVENVRDYAIYFLDANGYVKTWNAGGERIKGYAEEEAIGLHFSRFFTAEDMVRNKPAELLHQAAVHGRVEDEGWRVRKDGTAFWTDSILTAIYGLSGEIVGFTKVTRDVTTRKIAEDAFVEEITGEIEATSKALLATEKLYRTVIDSSPEAVSISRVRDGVVVDVNQAFLSITGYQRDEVIGHTASELRLWARGRDQIRFVELLRWNTSCRDLDFQFRRKNEEMFWARLTISQIEYQGAPCVLTFARDVTEVKRTEEKINDLACYDSLTGVANRRMLFERLTRSLAEPGRGSRYRALLFIDLDDFKTLNDPWAPLLAT